MIAKILDWVKFRSTNIIISIRNINRLYVFKFIKLMNKYSLQKGSLNLKVRE